jgi:hypothetical protein
MAEEPTPPQYDPEAAHRIKACVLMESLHIYLDKDPARARLMIDAAAVCIQIADHYQRVYKREGGK